MDKDSAVWAIVTVLCSSIKKDIEHTDRLLEMDGIDEGNKHYLMGYKMALMQVMNSIATNKDNIKELENIINKSKES